MKLRYIGAAIGALVGFTTPAAIGQIPPLTALPEEVLTVPVGTALGAAMGYYLAKELLE